MDDAARLIAILTEGRTLRTWSVLVTVFGDLALAPGQEVGGAVLTRLGEGMGLRAPAIRTALHRLRQDGWLRARPQGRASFHALTDAGRAQSLAAGPRIYGPPPGRAFLVVTEAGATVTAAPPGDAFTVELSAAPPDWLSRALCPPGTAAMARDTRDRLTAVAAGLSRPPTDPMQVAILRVLAVHAWRRVALRLPDLPDFVLPGGCDIRAGRAAFAAILSRLTAPDLSRLG